MRKIPYTENGIKRIKCFRCGAQASQQWQICSDNNVYRGICTNCDILLNKVVLKFMGIEDYKQKIKKYKNFITRQ